MPKVLVNNINFHYWQVGDGPHMVMIHGLTGNLASWHFTILPALRQEYRITTYDLRGHGHSDTPPTGYTTLAMAEDLHGILNALGIERAVLVGHSMGADIALHFALRYPERVSKIVAIEAGLAALVHLRKDTDWPGWAEWARGLEQYAGVTVPREKWHDIDYMLRASLQAPVVFGPGRGLPRKGDKLLKLLDTTTLVHDYQNMAGMTLDELACISQPVLLVYGGNSHYLGTYDTLRQKLPVCTGVLIEGSDHFGVVQHPERLIFHMRQFFALEQAVGQQQELA